MVKLRNLIFAVYVAQEHVLGCISAKCVSCFVVCIPIGNYPSLLTMLSRNTTLLAVLLGPSFVFVFPPILLCPFDFARIMTRGWNRTLDGEQSMVLFGPLVFITTITKWTWNKLIDARDEKWHCGRKNKKQKKKTWQWTLSVLSRRFKWIFHGKTETFLFFYLYYSSILIFKRERIYLMGLD